jgi:hypothetical protein
MPENARVRRDFLITVYQDGDAPQAIRVEFIPRGHKGSREPAGLPKRVPAFLVRAQVERDKIVADWEVPPPKSYKGDPEALKQEAIARLTKRVEWLDRLSELIARMEQWAQSLGWSTRRVRKELKDAEIGAYETRALLLQQETTRLLLEPVGRSAPGAEGVVDLYLLPAYDDIASLYYYDNRWNLHYLAPGSTVVGNIREADSKPLSKTSLRYVLDEMKQHVA